MSRRIIFWWRTLKSEAAELNAISGWLSLVVLILGVAGIAVPLVLNLSLWLTGFTLLALIGVVMLEGAYRVWHSTDQSRHAAIAERVAAEDELGRRFSAQRYALQFDGTDVIVHPTSSATGAVELGVSLTNASDDSLRYEVEYINVTIDGRHSAPNTPVLGRGNLIKPHGVSRYQTTVYAVSLPWNNGTLKIAVRYGHPSAPLRYRTTRNMDLRHVQLTDQPDGQNDKVITGFIGDFDVEDI